MSQAQSPIRAKALARNWQRRTIYLVCAVAVIAMGLASRRYGSELPVVVSKYAGDTLWALTVYLGISVMVPGARVFLRGVIAIVFAYAIEISQLYHAPWIDILRRTTFGGLVLGYGFLWTDFICYTTGVMIGVAADYFLSSTTKSYWRNRSRRNQVEDDIPGSRLK